MRRFGRRFCGDEDGGCGGDCLSERYVGWRVGLSSFSQVGYHRLV